MGEINLKGHDEEAMKCGRSKILIRTPIALDHFAFNRWSFSGTSNFEVFGKFSFHFKFLLVFVDFKFCLF